jgi:hypothetical protein
MKTKEELELLQKEINNEVENLKDQVSGATGKPDGIINIEKYLNAELRIMWVLKEINSDGDGYEWNMIDTIKDWSGKSIPIDWRKTFDNILYTTNGILTSTLWEDQPDQDENPEITHQLSKIAYCNVKKVPGTSQTNMSKLKRYYETSKKLVLKQINELEPQIIIFGNTYDIIEPDLSNLDYKTAKYKTMEAYFSPEQIMINAYHPQYFKIDPKDYCNDIINAVLDWKKYL